MDVKLMMMMMMMMMMMILDFRSPTQKRKEEILRRLNANFSKVGVQSSKTKSICDQFHQVGLIDFSSDNVLRIISRHSNHVQTKKKHACS